MSSKGWTALGAFDAAERTEALDLLGFHRQLVFSTFAPTQFESERDLDLLYGGSLATTRAIVDFCAHDDRLMPVGTLPLSDPERSAAAVAEAIAMGCPAILVPSRPRAEVSPTHPSFDPVWAQLAEAGVPFMLHVGGGGAPIHRTFHQNGRTVTDFLGGGENLRAKDFMGIHVVGRDLPRRDRPRRRVRALPGAARRLHRARRDVGRAVAASASTSPRPRSSARSRT